MPALSTGMTAPSFQLPTTTGERLSLPEALARGPVLLAFFKVSCPTCQFTFPFLQRLYEQLREQGVQTWGIAQDKAADGVRFAAAFGITFPILVDNSPYKVSRAYGLTHVPSLYLIQPDGRIEISGEGFCKADLLAIQQSMAQSLSATPPALFLPSERIPEFKPG
jgi:peroxiredoxin